MIGLVYILTVLICVDTTILNPPINAFTLPSPPNMSGVFELNNLLSGAKRMNLGITRGPESFAVYQGKVYASTHNGIYRLGDEGAVFITSITNESCATFYAEKTCGRPLGIEFDKNGLLYIADAYFGIYTYNIITNVTDVIVSKKTLKTQKAKFINSLQISKSGDLYFTSSSSYYDRTKFLHAIIEGRSDGRLFKYNLKSKSLSVVLKNLTFPNGLLLTPTNNALLIAETGKAQILRYDLTHNTTVVFIKNLPLLPDNIKYNLAGNIMVASGTLRFNNRLSIIDTLAPLPAFREVFTKVFNPRKMAEILPKYGLVIEIHSENKSIIRSLYDTSGKVFALSEALQVGQKLYLGSYITPFYSILDLNHP